VKISLLAVGNKMPSWVTEGFSDYQKRLQSFEFELVEIQPVKRSKTLSADKICELEGDKILSKIQSNMLVVALEVTGKSMTTEKLAVQLENWMQITQHLCLIIGGPDGLSKEVLQRANQKWSLSALTYPHPLARLIVVEQIYRAWSINNNHPYHRAG
jgi:23S rRNA (pseudouridine1915-N3)-methyltransferase